MDNNKDFVAIPIQRIKKLIEYKAKLVGIEVNIINESFTSGCSALDLEELNKDNYDKSRRIERGLFVTNDNIKINADVNGALNILRKFLKSTPDSVKRRRDKGSVGHPPQRIRIA